MPTINKIINDTLALSKKNKTIAYWASVVDMSSRVDHVLDRHIDDVEKGVKLENMLKEAAKEFFARPMFGENLRNTEFLEINYKNYLLIERSLYFDCQGNPIQKPILPEKRYSQDLTFNTFNRANIGTATVYGNGITGYDEGFLKSFAEKLNTAILSFNRRKFNIEKDLMLFNLNNIMGNDILSIVERRQCMLDEIVERTASREGYVVLLKDGRKPTIRTIAKDDLEVKEISNESLDEEKEDYILEKALYVIKTPEEVDFFDDAKDRFGYALATELKVNETGKIGGAFVLFDDREYLSSRQAIAEAAGLKVDDYIIFDLEMREEIELRKRMEEVLIPMVGEEQANFLIKEHNFQKFSKPQPRFVVIMLSDMKGSTKAADNLMRESRLLKEDDPMLHEKYKQYVQQINRYLGLGTEAVLRFGGVIDKYIGDAVMAVWGIPIEAKDKKEIAVKSLLAAVYANKLTLSCKNRMKNEGIDDLFIFEQRFVLHCGEGLAGVYGTNLRFNYTIMGHAPNEAARLEGLSVSETGVVTMSGDFYELVSDVVYAESKGEFMLKGKDEPMQVYHFKKFNIADFTGFARKHMDPKQSTLLPANEFFEQYVMGKGDHV